VRCGAVRVRCERKRDQRPCRWICCSLMATVDSLAMMGHLGNIGDGQHFGRLSQQKDAEAGGRPTREHLLGSLGGAPHTVQAGLWQQHLDPMAHTLHYSLQNNTSIQPEYPECQCINHHHCKARSYNHHTSHIRKKETESSSGGDNPTAEISAIKKAMLGHVPQVSCSPGPLLPRKKALDDQRWRHLGTPVDATPAAQNPLSSCNTRVSHKHFVSSSALPSPHPAVPQIAL